MSSAAISCGVGVVGDREDVQADLPGPGYLLARPTRAVASQPHPQGGVPAHQAAQQGRRVFDGPVLGQFDASAHAELVAAVLHILQDRLLAPGQRLNAGLCSGEPDDDPVPAGLLEHSSF